jgi:Negative regulator of sigma F
MTIMRPLPLGARLAREQLAQTLRWRPGVRWNGWQGGRPRAGPRARARFWRDVSPPGGTARHADLRGAHGGDPLEASGAPGASLAELSPWGLRCLAIAVTVGLLVLVSLTAALRRSGPVASRLRGAALGAAAGAWAGLGVFLFCPATDHRHLLVGHVLPIAILTLLGLAAVPRALRP